MHSLCLLPLCILPLCLTEKKCASATAVGGAYKQLVFFFLGYFGRPHGDNPQNDAVPFIVAKLPIRARLQRLEGRLGVKQKKKETSIYGLRQRRTAGFYDVLMSRNAIRPAIKSIDRKGALEFRKGIKQKGFSQRKREPGGMSSKVKLER